MICIIGSKNKLYKKTLLDIWGHHYRYRKISKSINFIRVMRREDKTRYRYYKREFVYGFRKRIRFHRKKLFKKHFLDKRLLKSYYLVLSYRNFRKYMDIAKRKKGNYINNYLTLLEGRLFMMAYRSNFITNIFLIKYIIKKGLFTINGKVRYHYNYILKHGDLLQVSFDYRKYFYKDLLLRLYNGIIFYNIPKYMFANYNFLFVLFHRHPRLEDLVFPISLDVFLGSEYYYP